MRISDWSSDVCASDLRAAAQAEKGDDLMVAEVDRQVVGFVSFGPTRTPALPYSGEVYALYVALDWHSQGLGRRLLATALAALAKEGHRRALAWVISANPARFFSSSHGGERPGGRPDSLT